MPYPPYHEFLQKLLKQHETIVGFDQEAEFMADAQQKLQQLSEHASACLRLQKQRISLDDMAREIGISVPDTSSPSLQAHIACVQHEDGPGAESEPAPTKATSTEKPCRKTPGPSRWTELELAFIRDNYKRMSAAELSKHLPGRTSTAVQSKINKLRASDGGMIRKRQRSPAAEPVSVPERLVDLKIGARLKAVRLYNSKTVTDVASETKIDKKIIYDVENGKTTPSGRYMELMSMAYNVPADRLIKAPINNLIPFNIKDPFCQRLRALRCRAGVSADILSKKLGIHPNSLASFEKSVTPDEATVCAIANALNIPRALLAVKDPAPSSNP